MFSLPKAKKVLFLRAEIHRELSSVGSEHRPYKAGVVGSSPTVPTKTVETRHGTSLLFL